MTTEGQAALHCVVFGRVQGVGFRYFVLHEAVRLGLTGWVRNRQDGRSVELIAEGPVARLEELRQLLGTGPPGAWVERVECSWEEPSGSSTSFSIQW